MRPSPEHLLDYREFPVLCVDDEVENLRLMRRALGEEFQVITASSGEEALGLIAEQPVAIVITDHRMRGMKGVELLGRIRSLDPKTIRILVTAYGDAETLGEAINDGSIYRYLPKPWEPPELELTVRRGIEVYALDRERDELVRELTILNWVSKIISQELELDPLLDLLLETLTSELGFDSASLLVADVTRHSLVCVRSTAHGPAERGALEISKTESPRFFRHLCSGEARVLVGGDGRSQEEAVRRFWQAMGAPEVLVVPLLAKGELLGAMAVDNRSRGRPFSASDHTLLEGIASQAAIALGNARLVEDLRRSRQQVARAERLGTLGTLAAGLAHEINNPLVSIHTFLSLASAKRLEDDPEFWGRYHELACTEVERIRGLVATMSRLGRGSQAPAVEVPTDLGELAQEVVTLLAREARGAQVSLSIEIDEGAPKVLGVRDQLQQVLLNLVLNALQATSAGGQVVLQTRSAPAGGAVLEVSDSGSGIPAADLERIFDPFFTTKDPDQGTGLGLMICHGIVSAHGGSIEVESRPGIGTRFRVWLPAAADAGPSPLDPSTAD